MPRAFYMALGWAFVGIGFVGIFLPLLPTTVFIILAAACFARSSPRLEAWLVNHPRFGPALRAWRADRSMTTRHKALAVGAMCASIGATVILARGMPVAVRAALLAVAAAVSAYILTRPTRRR
jgi:hypothetical protein